MFLAIFEMAFVALIIVTIITQIVMPFLRGTPVFPILQKEAKLQSTLEETKQKIAEKEITDKITNLKKELGDESK